ncbi:MAG: histidine kinase dimerization/phosphoacceptor domain -containing protein, partial [Candidatus Aminicenantales bacterium]
GEAVSFTELAKEGKSVFFETVRHRMDGSPVDVSLLASPITVNDRVVAVYGIYRDITVRRKAEQALRKRSAQLELIHTIQNEIPMSMDTETLLKSAAENIGKAFGYSKVSVNLLDKETREIVNLVTWNISGTPTPRGHRQRMGEGLIGKAAELRRKIVANDVSKEPSHRLFYQTETKSELAIPLLAKDNLVGILDIQDVKKNTFTEDDVTVLQSIANYLAYVIDERQKEESLKVSLKEKEILLREIHHRVKNNLQVISSLLSLQSRHIRGRKNIEMFKESQERVKSMALIHEKLYQSQEIARINFREYIQTLVNNLFRSYKASLSQITLKMDVEDVSIGVDNAIPCGLIINELVSNSLKYAFADGRKGEIRIALHPLSEKDIELVISDNGVGMPEDLDFRKTDSLGLHLVTILAEDQLQGKINLDRSQGTEFRIRLRGVRE